MFFTRERQAGAKYLEGRIVIHQEHMKVRKGQQSVYYYTVAWTDYTLNAGVPDASLSPEDFEALRKV